jgi:hypothetical protein
VRSNGLVMVDILIILTSGIKSSCSILCTEKKGN